MNLRRVIFALLMVTMFIVPLVLGLVSAGVATGYVLGYRATMDFFRWLYGPKEKP